MSRVPPREMTAEPDSPVVASFGGLSSASYNLSGDIIYQHKLINAYVNKSGEIVTRSGSTAHCGLSVVSLTAEFGVFRFNFDNVRYILVKVGTDLLLFQSFDGVNYSFFCNKLNVFDSRSESERPSFTSKVEGNLCYVFIATKNTQCLCLVLLRSAMNVAAVSGSTISGNLLKPVNGSVLTGNNTLIKISGVTYTPSAGMTHSGASISVSNAAFNSVNVPVGRFVEFHSAFILKLSPASYYPGLYLVNSALRRNTVPLDVNVQVPVALADNPIINEGTQPVNIPTLRVYAGATEQTFVAGLNPSATNQWSFSDGGYYTGAGLLTNPSPAFISFGGLVAGGQNTTISLSRLRKVLGNGRTTSDYSVFVDKAARTPQWFDANGNALVGAVPPVYFAFASPNVNLNLAAVVEVIDIRNYAGSSMSSTTIADFDLTAASIVVGDGFCIPMYGYSYMYISDQFPSLVTFVGNRLVFASSSSVYFGSADWSYRGVTWNNFQVSTINFNGNSAFEINLSQGTSNIRGLAQVSGVTVVGSDNGIYRIANNTGSQPASADNAVVSKVSNEIIPNNNCFTTYDNKIFYVSSQGFFQLQYENEANTLVNTSLSRQVNDKFTVVDGCTYSEANRSFIISFKDKSEMLALNVDSLSWYTIKLAALMRAFLERDSDGFYFVFQNSTTRYLLSCFWNNKSTTDIDNLGPWFGINLPSRSLTITQSATSCDALVCPAELIKTLTNANVVVAAGDNHARVQGVSSVVINEYVGARAPLPINSYVVSKGFYGDRLDRSYRLRGISLLLTGAGELVTRLATLGDSYSDRTDEVRVWSVGDNTFIGEGLLNAEFPTEHVRAYEGDTIAVKLRSLGIKEALSIAVKLSIGLGFLGMQFDSSRKSLKRLR